MPDLRAEAFPAMPRFHCRRCLGAGGMGVVYEAFDDDRQEVVALKTMSLADPVSLYRFKREFRALADVSHPNLVKLYELFSTAGQWFFTMELIDGSDLFRHVSGRDRPWAEVRDLLRQLVEGVTVLHQAGHLHRDIKPSNVLVAREGRLVLLDFGLVADLDPRGASDTSGYRLVGTPFYMAPEQALGQPLTTAADWYGVGALLYKVLTKEVPFAPPSASGTSLVSTVDMPSDPPSPSELGDVTATSPEPISPHRSEWLQVLAAKQRSEPTPPGGLVPGIPADLDRICVGLLRRRPEDRIDGREVLRLLETAPPTVPAAPATAPLRRSGRGWAPFVGRAPHLAALADALASVRRGRPVTVLVHGVSGVGKTALLRQFLDNLPDRERMVVLEGRCYHQESAPYKALDGVVDMLSQHLAGLSTVQQAELMPRDIAALAQVFPVVGRVAVFAGAPRRGLESQDPHALRRKAFAALRELLARVGDRDPLVVYIDDLQWGDVDSAAVLHEILRPPDPPPMLLLTAYRREDAERSVLVRRLLESRSRTAIGSDVRMLAVDPLQPAETRELAGALVARGGGAASGGLVDQIVRESGNHPYFVKELVEHARSAVAGSPPAPPTARVSLERVLQERLGGLSEDARQLLDSVVVAGRPILQPVAFAASGLGGGGRAALDHLLRANFVKASGTEDGVLLEPFHDRIRESRLEQISEVDRRAQHERLAASLQALGRVDPEELAAHLVGAGEVAKAAHFTRMAAERAAAALAFDRAAILYARTLELLGPEAEEARLLVTRLADALANSGRSAEAAASYLQAARGAPAHEALELQRLAAEHLLASGHMDEGLEVAQRVLATVHMRLPRSPKAALAALLLTRARIRVRGLSYRERDLGEIPPRLITVIDTCWSIALGLAVVDNIRGADFQARHLLLALRAGEPYRVARALAMEAGFYAVRGGPTEKRAAQLTRAAVALANRTGNQHALGLALTTEGMAAYLVGRWRRAFDLCERAIEILQERCVGVTWELASAQRFMIAALLFLGDLHEMGRRMPTLLEEADQRGNLYASTNLRTRMSHMVWLAADDPESSRRELEDAMGLWTHRGFHLQHYSALFGHAQTDLYVGDGEAALARLQESWSALDRSLLRRVQVLDIEVLHLRARAALASCRGRDARAARLLRQAESDARAIERRRMAWAEPLAAAARAGVAARRGQRDLAIQQVARAAAGFDAADMALFAAAARRQWGALIGGADGADLVREADAWMTGQTVENPARMSAMLVPGVTG